MAIKNEKSRDTGKAGHRTQKEDKENIAHINKNISNTDPTKTTGVNRGA